MCVEGDEVTVDLVTAGKLRLIIGLEGDLEESDLIDQIDPNLEEQARLTEEQSPDDEDGDAPPESTPIPPTEE